MSDPIIIADGYSAEPYGDTYIISHCDGGRRFAELDMAAAVREIARLREQCADYKRAAELNERLANRYEDQRNEFRATKQQRNSHVR